MHSSHTTCVYVCARARFGFINLEWPVARAWAVRTVICICTAMNEALVMMFLKGPHLDFKNQIPLNEKNPYDNDAHVSRYLR